MSDYLQPHGLQHTRLPCPPLSLAVCSNSCPLSLWCQPTISSSIVPFSCFQSFPASGPFPMSQLFASGGQSIGASATVLPMNIQGWFPLRLMVWSPCCPRDSQECSPPPQFEGINSLVLCLLRGPTLTSIRDYWKNHSFAYMQLCQQSDVCAFLIHCLGLLQPFFQGANVFSFHGCSHCPQGFWSPRK